MLLLGRVEGFEGLDRNEGLLAAFGFQKAEGVFGDSPLVPVGKIDGKGVGVTAVDELTAAVVGIDACKKDLEKLGKGDFFLVVADSNRLAVSRFAAFDL